MVIAPSSAMTWAFRSPPFLPPSSSPASFFPSFSSPSSPSRSRGGSYAAKCRVAVVSTLLPSTVPSSRCSASSGISGLGASAPSEVSEVLRNIE